jgi:hypothetical protein
MVPGTSIVKLSIELQSIFDAITSIHSTPETRDLLAPILHEQLGDYFFNLQVFLWRELCQT